MLRSTVAGLALVSAAFPISVSLAQETATRPSLSAEPAEAGTQEGAERLKQALSDYLTNTPFEEGIVTIEPDPAGQRILVHPADALSKATGTPVRFEPMSFVVSEREDGNWNVFSDEPLDAKVSFELEGAAQEEEYKQEWQVFKGVYSPELGVFLSGEAHSGPTTQTSRDDVSSTVVTIASTFAEFAGRPAEDGGADVEFRQTYENYAQTASIEIPMEDPAEPVGFTFDATIADMEASGSMSNTRARAIIDLYAVAISHLDALVADPQGAFAGEAGTDIMNAAREALPFWGEMDVRVAAGAMKISTIYGELSVAESRQDVRMSGVAEDAFLETEFAMSGMEAVSPLMPGWAEPLVPNFLGMKFGISNANLAQPLDIALRELDFSQDPPLSEAAQGEIIGALNAGEIETRIENGRLAAETYEVDFEGEMSLFQSAPEARFAVDMRGLDDTIAALQTAAAEQPELYEAIGMLQIAKGFGEAGEEGRTRWEIETAADGSVTINGNVISGPTVPADPLLPSDPAGEDQPGDL